jgi:tetratricopeptide (TPR) repeat protein
MRTCPLTLGGFVVLATIMPALARPAAYCNWTINDPKAVVQECTKQLHLRSPESWMYFNRGLALKMLGQLEKAHLDYSKAIELNPTFAAAYTNRGNVRLLRNDSVGAIEDFRTALELDPSDVVARENLSAIEEALRELGIDNLGRDAVTAPTR